MGSSKINLYLMDKRKWNKPVSVVVTIFMRNFKKLEAEHGDMPIMPALWEVKVGGSLELRSLRLD